MTLVYTSVTLRIKKIFKKNVFNWLFLVSDLAFFDKISKICSFKLRSCDILLLLRKFLAFLTRLLLILSSPDHLSFFPECYTVMILYSWSVSVITICKLNKNLFKSCVNRLKREKSHAVDLRLYDSVALHTVFPCADSQRCNCRCVDSIFLKSRFSIRFYS